MPYKISKFYCQAYRQTFSLVTTLLLLTIVSVNLSSAKDQTEKSFKIFESLNFAGGPDFRQFGLEHMTIVDPHVLGPDVPDSLQVRKALDRPRSNQNLVIDIERWPLDGSETSLETSLTKYKTTLQSFRRADPNVKLGLYSVLPVRDYWRAIGTRGPEQLMNWKTLNSKVAAALVPDVDILYPSLYTFYGDKDAWVKYARANLQEAHRISGGKPVYCFLWPQFHRTLAFVPGDFWYAQLETCRQFADGIVIWGTIGGNSPYRPSNWDEKAEWWQATLQFLGSLKKLK